MNLNSNLNLETDGLPGIESIRNQTEETRVLMSGPWYTCSVPVDQAAKQGALHPHYGKIRASKAETIALMRINHPHTKAVFQYTSDRMTFVAKPLPGKLGPRP